VIIGLPAHDVCPFDGLELAFHGFFGRCGVRKLFVTYSRSTSSNRPAMANVTGAAPD
jgi:hypothetical protein